MQSVPRARIEAICAQLGFCRMGIASAERLEKGADRLSRWLAAGYHGNMTFMESPRERADPRTLLPEAKSVIVVAMAYPRPTAARIASYAQGEDYHHVIRQRLYALAQRLETEAQGVRFRVCVDTAPILEREIAAKAGLGFVGKSCMTIVPGLGTYVLLGSLLCDLDLPTDAPAQDKCGSCTACIDACPTGAFIGPRQLDARRCISYLTIEHQGPIPRHLRPLMGEHLFGCDICQSVCPFNASKKPRPTEPNLHPKDPIASVTAEQLLTLTASGYRKLVRHTALARTNRAQLGRNAAIALGNRREPASTKALHRAMESRYPLIRGHSAWALGQIATHGALEILKTAFLHEKDHWVQDEIQKALYDARKYLKTT